jgi:hypothetical protein
MATWSEVEAEIPELAAQARTFFDAGMHKTIATLRRDGSPRLSGTECLFTDGDLWFGSMWQARKAQDSNVTAGLPCTAAPPTHRSPSTRT